MIGIIIIIIIMLMIKKVSRGNRDRAKWRAS